MANLTTNHDIINDALFRAGEPIDGTSDFYAQTIIDYNRIYLALCSGGMELAKDVDEIWWWLRKPTPGIISLQPAFLGNAVVTFNSATVTLATPPAYSLKNWYLFPQNIVGDNYRISAHTSGNATVTLDSVYTGASSTAQAIKAIQFEYDLAADLRSVIGPMRISQGGSNEIDGCELETLLTRYPTTGMLMGAPRLFAMVGEQRVRFSHYPGDTADLVYRVEYDYLVVPGDLADDANTPLVPRQYRRVLSDYLTMWLMANKNDARSGSMGSSAAAALMSMALENRRRLEKLGHKFGQLIPRQDQIKRRTPVSTSGFYFP